MLKKPNVYYISIFLSIVAILFILSAFGLPGSTLLKTVKGAIGSITGQGTVNTLARFADAAGVSSNTIGDSIVFDDGAGHVGIGTTAPLSKLSINGGLHVGGDSDAGDNNALIDGALTVNGAGPHVLSASVASGTNSLQVRNTAAGSSYASFLMGNDSANNSLAFAAVSSNYPTFNMYIADGAVITANRVGGLSIAAGHASGVIRFYAGGSAEKMRLDASGKLGIGTTAPGQTLEVFSTTGTNARIRLTTTDTTATLSGYEFMSGATWSGGLFRNGSTNDLTIYTANNGSVPKVTILNAGNVGIGVTNPTHQLQLSLDDAAKPTSGTWTIVSDQRLKKNVVSFTDGLSVLTQINPVSYQLNGLGGTPDGAKGIGVIAQDVKDIVPYTISTFRAKLNPGDTTDTTLYDFNSSALTFVTINSIKELNARVIELDASNTRLEARVKALEQKIK